jgi:two-component system, LytTR family, sensor histidine kinase AlgZ
VLVRLSARSELMLFIVIELAIASATWWLIGEYKSQFSDDITPVPVWQFITLFIFVTACVLIYFNLRARELSPALAEARLQALQARIRPHFLFNSINAVLSLIRHEPKRAERMLEDMAELFRVLMADNRRLTPLSDELALCRRYLEIEQIRLGDRLNVEWNLQTLNGDPLVPPLMLQPLIENAVYHGIEPMMARVDTPSTLKIDISSRGKVLQIVLSNPYQTDLAPTHSSGNKMAIKNIRERLSLHFDAEASLTAKVDTQRYEVEINLPMIVEQNN